MKNTSNPILIITLALYSALLVVSCNGDEAPVKTRQADFTIVEKTFGTALNLPDLFNYEDQDIPSYITKDNSGANIIEDEIATLGRVLFYDKSLSIDNTVACASCHQQAFGFTDTSTVSAGVNGETGRHSMRLINSRFGNEHRFFWDERAPSLEAQSTLPIQDHVEMGFSGQDGNPDMDDLFEKMSNLDYYPELFVLAFGDETIDESRMQKAISQFVRSIQSFDSKYDEGRSQVNDDIEDFPNFSVLENEGKRLFITPPQFSNGQRVGGGLGCGGCHIPPEFDIDPDIGNNGFIEVAGSETETDLDVTKAPSLRDMFDVDGNLISGLMHTGSLRTFQEVLDHYSVTNLNPNIDQRLRDTGDQAQLNLTEEERMAVEAFVKTLTGSNVYTDPRWSDPFR